MGHSRKRTEQTIGTLIEDIGHDLAPDIGKTLRTLGYDAPPGLVDCFRTLAGRVGSDARHSHTLALFFIDLLESAYPQGAFVNLLRFVEASGATGVFLDTVSGGKPVRELLATVFGASQYMSDIIIRSPGNLYWLIERQTWERDETTDAFLEQLRADLANFDSAAAKLGAARRFQRRALLKIGVQDLLGLRSVEDTALWLSRLAEAITEGVLETLWNDIPGLPQDRRGFAVLALGKLGGEELNYSSDIDLIYICDDVDDGTIELYKQLAKRLTNALSEVTSEGYLYRVDLRLRPDGSVGPLVSPLASLMLYYEHRGRPWEFQAMLKARPLAGDRSVAQTLLKRIRSLTYNPSLSYSPVESVALMRTQIRESISSKERSFNIKLMEGGIRDVEFILQSLQLTHGARYNDVRVGNTVEGIRRVHRHKYLTELEKKTLLEAYRFFRLVEHRLQMMHQLKTHSIPDSAEEIELLARRVSMGPLGRFTRESFLVTLTNHLNKVRVLSDSFFSGEPLPQSARLLVLPQGDAQAQEILFAHRISDAKRAMGQIQTLAYGSFPNLVDRDTRRAFQKLLPVLLEEVAVTPDPDRTLLTFARIVNASRNPASFYRSLSESVPLRMMIRDIAGASPVLSQRLCRTMDSLSALLEEPERILGSDVTVRGTWTTGQSPAGYAGVRDAIDHEIALRTVAAWVVDVDAGTFPRSLSRALTQTLRAVVSVAFDALVDSTEGVVLLALGSFGVGEPRPKSDIDLLVVTAGRELEPVTRAVQSLNQALDGVSLPKLDFRLRGEGANAPLVQDIETYRRYFEERLSPWERIAFAKCALWTGDAKLAAEFFGLVTPYVTEAPSPAVFAALLDTRAQLERLVAADAAALETKRSPGGRYDIEYICALGLAQRGQPFALDTPTAERVALLAQAGVVSAEESRALTDALLLFERVDTLLDLNDVSLPQGERVHDVATLLDRTLELIGMPMTGGVETALAAHKAAVRACYERVTERRKR